MHQPECTPPAADGLGSKCSCLIGRLRRHAGLLRMMEQAGGVVTRPSYRLMEDAAEVIERSPVIEAPPQMEPHDFNADVNELSECQHCGWGKAHPLHESRRHHDV